MQYSSPPHLEVHRNSDKDEKKSGGFDPGFDMFDGDFLRRYIKKKCAR